MRPNPAMKRRIVLTLLFLPVFAVPAHAANIAAIANTPNILHLVVLIAAVIGLASAISVQNLVRGGALAKCWQLFMAGFGALVICQGILIGSALDFFVVPVFIVPCLLLVMAGLFLFGIYEAKRVLE